MSQYPFGQVIGHVPQSRGQFWQFSHQVTPPPVGKFTCVVSPQLPFPQPQSRGQVIGVSPSSHPPSGQPRGQVPQSTGQLEQFSPFHHWQVKSPQTWGNGQSPG